MSFTPNIPFSGQTLGSSRTQVKDNFTNYNTLVSVDHVGPLSVIPSNAFQGQHLQVTFNTFGNVASYTQTGNQSYLYSKNASNSGSALVYQPSVVANGTIVPVTPRAVCRAVRAAGVWSLSANGPYGANSTFNVGSITSTSAKQFTVNFSNALATADYFVMTAVEASGIAPTTGIEESAKTTSSFVVVIDTETVPVVTSIGIMVY